MYIFQNAIRNLFRNKGRNILLALILLAIITTSAVTLIISNTAEGIIEDYKARFGTEIRISPNMENFTQGSPQGGMQGGGMGGAVFTRRASRIPAEQLLAFSESDLLQSTDLSATLRLYSDTLEPVGGDTEGNAGGMLSVRPGNGEDAVSISIPDFTLQGHDDLNLLTSIVNGERVVTEGRLYEKDGEGVISRELADANGLAVGDTMEFYATDPTGDGERVPLTLTVVGIYEDLVEDENAGYGIAMMNRGNEILTSLGTLLQEDLSSMMMMSVEATYRLKSPDLLEAFKSELQAKGLDLEEYTVSMDTESYNNVVAPVEGMRSVTLTFLWVVLILGGLVIVLLSVMSIRERRYEIGVLRAMGMKKSRLSLGLLSETLVLTLLCLVLGLGAGAVAAQPVSDVLIRNQTESTEQEQSQSQQQWGGGRQMIIAGGRAREQEPPLEHIDASLSALTLLELSGLSLLLAIAAGAAGVAQVTRYEPMRILSDRA